MSQSPKLAANGSNGTGTGTGANRGVLSPSFSQVNTRPSSSDIAQESVERAENLFNQLDTMIQVVQKESSNQDRRLEELDNMRNQLGTLTKRLLEADRVILGLKTDIVKLQEALSETKQKKSEVDAALPPLRQELNRTKDMYGKERSARLSAQQEISMLKDQLTRLEQINMVRLLLLLLLLCGCMCNAFLFD